MYFTLGVKLIASSTVLYSSVSAEYLVLADTDLEVPIIEDDTTKAETNKKLRIFLNFFFHFYTSKFIVFTFCVYNNINFHKVLSLQKIKFFIICNKICK